MEKPAILFIQGGGENAHKEDKKLVESLQQVLDDTYDISFPKMPDENDPRYENYALKIAEEINKAPGKLILAGHSLGSCFLLKYLSENKIDDYQVQYAAIATSVERTITHHGSVLNVDRDQGLAGTALRPADAAPARNHIEVPGIARSV